MKSSEIKVRIEPELKKRFKDALEKDGRKISPVVIACIKEYIEEVEARAKGESK